MPMIFISHSTKDDHHATAIHNALEAAGITAWVDHEDGIGPGDRWPQQIQEAANTCDAGLFILTPNSAKSAYCEAEWTRVLDRKKTLYIALAEAVPLEDAPLRLGIIQYTDVRTDFEGGMAALIAAIHGKKPAPDADAPTTGTMRRITGVIARPLTQIPIRGREADIAAVLEDLRHGPTVICGAGGLGKSRLAAEIALHSPDVSGAIWFRIEDVSSPDGVYELLRRHFDLETTVDPADVLARLRGHKHLVVLDNAESVPPERRAAYVGLVHALTDAGAQVLLTSRLRWDEGEAEIALARHHTPTSLPLDAAAQIVRDMGAAYAVPLDVDPHAERIAAACHNHPRLIEWAVKLLHKRGLNDVLAEFEGLSGKKAEAALDEMLHRTLRQMTTEAGPAPEAALRKLVVFQGGFTRTAAKAILGDTVDDLPDVLDTLQSWPFVTLDHQPDGRARYSTDQLAIDALDSGVNEAIREAHYNYYKSLAKDHDKRTDYLGLDPDSDNLEAAFEWAMDAARYANALDLFNACGIFLANRGRFIQRMDWIERIAAALQDTDDDKLRTNAQNSLGIVYQDHPFGNRKANLARAITAYTEALHFRTPEAAPLDYARTQNNLGIAYRDLASIEDRPNNLKRAIVAFSEALQFRTLEKDSFNYAGTLTNLAVAYRNLSFIEEKTHNLKLAITAYNEALRFLGTTIREAPLDYSRAQNNLGITYLDLALIENKVENLKIAMDCFIEALRFSTPRTAPLAYARYQNNLGVAYYDLSMLQDTEFNLEKAIQVYHEALHFRTPEADPIAYANTMGNLAETYCALSKLKDKKQNLSMALDAIQKSIPFCPYETVPLYYAENRKVEGTIYHVSGDIVAALAAWQESERSFRQMGHIEDADELLRWIANAEDRLNSENNNSSD